jgi:hypothetical protein
MPRAFIIAMASGGIWGMFAICMVELTVHRPGLPWAAHAAAGARITAEAIKPETSLRCMAVPRYLWRKI